jgi:TPR repeat protein
MLKSLCLLAFCILPGTLHAETRVALVIGNGDYTAVGRLPNARPDAEAIGSLLEGQGFKVSRVTDADRRTLKDALSAFEDASSRADVAVIYYSGHGLQMEGENWIVPVDAHLARSRDIEDEAISLRRLRQTVVDAHRLKVIILDACRDNPFLKTMVQSSRAATARGLTRVEAQSAEVIAFAAAEGATAADGTGGHSPYTTALINRLKEPIDIRKAFGYVYEDVKRATTPPSGNEAEAQKPAVYVAALGGDDVFLADGPPRAVAVEAGGGQAGQTEPQQALAQPQVSPPALPVSDPCINAGTHWTAIASRGDKALFEEHIRRFKGCGFETLATLELKKLEAQAAAAAPEPVAPPVPTVLPVIAPQVSALPNGKTPATELLSTPAGVECDRLAASPNDPQRPNSVPGVETIAIDGPAAIAACKAAVAAKPGEPRYAYQLGRALARQKDYASAVPIYRKAAEAGYLAAQNNMGTAYEEGRGVPKDQAEAVRWFRRAAAGGLMIGQYNLARSMLKGEGMPKDVAGALSLLEKTAALNLPNAQVKLAELLDTGREVPADPTRAFTLLKRAADQGYVPAYIRLATAYQNGRGTPQNIEQAMTWAKAGAERNSAAAAYLLGTLYANGPGTTKNPADAARWLVRSAELGAGGLTSKGLLEIAPKLDVATKRAIQQELANRQVLAGPVNGTFGPATLAAIDQITPKSTP